MPNMIDGWPVYFKATLIVGNLESNVGICTLWTNKQLVAKGLDPKDYAVLGNLYSFGGINGIIRNTLANPNIRYLVVCGADASRSGEAIKAFFEKGVDGDYGIPGFPAKIHAEIPKAAIDIMRKKVELIDMRGTFDAAKITGRAKLLAKLGPFAPPAIYPEAKPKTEFLESELTGFRVGGRTVAQTWLKLLKLVMQYGETTDTHYEARQKEILNTVAVVTGEDASNPHYAAFFPFTKEDMDSYYPQWFSGELPQGMVYSYGNRLRNFDGMNQIEYIIALLKREPGVRKAIAVLYEPRRDNEGASPHAPCMTQMLAIVKKGKLYVTAHFRSHDIYDAWPRNALALRRVQKEIADAVGTPLGPLTIVSHSAHAYENVWQNADAILEKHWPKSIAFEEDPRGNFIITLSGGKIVCEHANLAGPTGMRFEGVASKQVLEQVLLSDLASLPSHWAYLGQELLKAELCLNSGKPYVQDTALPVM